MMETKNGDNIVAREEKPEDRDLDLTLRPRRLQEFVGQEKLKKSLEIFMEAAKKRGDVLEHLLIHGNSGLGKTTLSHIIAHEMGVSIRVTSGPAIERAGDLAAILTNLAHGDIIFIDECHRLNRIVEEILYPAMEDYAIDLVIGKGPSARTLRLDLPHFTLIGATTRPSLLSSPLRDRFGMTYELSFYEDSDIEKIVNRSAGILSINLGQDVAKIIAQRSRKTPRVANRLLKRVRDFAQVKGVNVVDTGTAKEALDMLEIDRLGLTETDRKILKTMIEKFAGGPVGLGALAAATRQEKEALEEIYEPFLIQLGFLNRTLRGRIATEAAYKHLGFIKTQEHKNTRITNVLF